MICPAGIWTTRAGRILTSKLGSRGRTILTGLLTEIYCVKGYYMPWTDADVWSFLSVLPSDVSSDDVCLAIRIMLDEGFLDDQMLEKYHVLTSPSIQKTYFERVDYRKRGQEEYEYVYEGIISRKCEKELILGKPGFSAEKLGLILGKRGFSAEKPPFLVGKPGFSAEKPETEEKKEKKKEQSPQTPLKERINKKEKISPPKPPLGALDEEKDFSENPETIERDREQEAKAMRHYEEVYQTLDSASRHQSDMLREALTELGVPDGIQARLQGVSHFGQVGNEIWKHIARLRGDSRVRGKIENVGGYLCACMGLVKWKRNQ